MNNMHFFYIGGMMFLSIGNAVQIGKGVGRKILSWLQITIYTSTLIWYFISQIKTGLTSSFFFFSTLAFVLSLLLEVFEVAKKGKMTPLDALVFLLSLAPVVFSIGIMSGMF